MNKKPYKYYYNVELTDLDDFVFPLNKNEMNYERVLLLIKDRSTDVELEIKNGQLKLKDGRYEKLSLFLQNAIKNLIDEYDELNAAYSLIEKQNSNDGK